MNNQYKKVLITGGSGFIGQHLTNILLNKNCHVSILDRSPMKLQKLVDVFAGDIRDQSIVTKAMRDIDIVYHLAGVLGTEELNTQSILATKINVVGTLNTLNAALKNKTKVLLVSKPNVWLNTYSITKDASEKFCKMYQKEFGLKATIVKWFSVYGPGQKHYGVQKAVPTFIVKALTKKSLPIFGDGLQMADFIYVADAVSATVLAAEDPKMEGETVEIGTGKGTQIIDLAKKIIRLSHTSSGIKFIQMRGGEIPNSKVVANIKLLKSLGFKPKISLLDGLEKTIKFYKNIVKSDTRF